MFDRNQLPHALLIHGPVGIGRRLLSFWLADRILGGIRGIDDPALLGTERIDDELLPMHPDFRLLQPGEKKDKPGEFRKTIGIDQVRELIGFLTLTSHQSGAKVVVVTPAQAMTVDAANSLLKTLEEPAADTYLVLVAASMSRLPATIVSRCHRIRLSRPDSGAAHDWLAGLDPTIDWHRALELSEGAPIAAVELERIGFPKLSEELQRDLSALERCADTPAVVAKRWAKHDPECCLRWLSARVSREIRSQFERDHAEPKQKTGNRRLQKMDETLNIEPSFAVLRQIGELRRLHGAGLTAELHLSDVLARWYGGI